MVFFLTFNFFSLNTKSGTPSTLKFSRFNVLGKLSKIFFALEYSNNVLFCSLHVSGLPFTLNLI